MTFKMTDTNRVITIHNPLSVTNEFTDKGDGYISANTGLPAYCTDIAPPVTKDEFITVFSSESGKWSLVKDHRGKIVYDIYTEASTVVNQLSRLPDGVVSIAPEGHFVEWDGEKRVHDADVEKMTQTTQAIQQKESLLALVTSKITPLQDVVDLDITTEAEAVLIPVWRKYRVSLNHIEPNDAPYNNWPDIPDGE